MSVSVLTRVATAGKDGILNSDKSCHCEEPQATKQSRPRVGTVVPRLLPRGSSPWSQ
jgi:hypothetical protein